MADEDLVAKYRSEVDTSVAKEAERRVDATMPMKERIRLRSLSLSDLAKGEISNSDFVPALLERLGAVRAALDGHGGGVELMKVSQTEVGLEFVLDLTGACLSCGAAPGTLAGVRADLENDPEIAHVRFSSTLLDTFDDLGREFVLAHGGVEFVDI
ncbi:MAG TPA: NifU family protein [Candidatus Poseidoniales archaeon]|jgi:Fe-S cluster biogenesis protein NfuA|nr:MAG: hypothetical protein CXT69_01790 [Euryarchaeota archaeon]HIG03693.1 NifU family protein [Candidatus Poseidoniales archaeon]HIK78113.1 NifU family protein [Candidatus Poseidoniales archaeon]